MPTDRELLDRYVAEGSGPAFDALVERHARMVHATCRRTLKDEHSAEDAAQAAFVLLARNAARLSRNVVLSGWMYLTARNCAKHLQRSQDRRRRHETEASLMRDQNERQPSREEISPALDAALVSLSARQCQAVVLRYLGGRSYSEAAEEMRCAESTFKNHLANGLTRLRAKLASGGTVLSAAALVAHLEAQAQVQLPAGFAAAVHASCVGAASASPSVLAVAAGAAKTMWWAKVKLIAIVLCTTAAAAGAGAWGVKALSGARTYYVSPNGSEGNPGTRERPFADPLKAAALLEPGDTLYFRAGTYRCKTDGLVGLAPARSGRPGAPITFMAYPGEHVTVDGTGSNWGFTPNGRSHVVIDGFEIRNSTGYGVKISARNDPPERRGSHIVVRNCRVIDTMSECIFARLTPHVRVENCLVSGSRTSHGVSIQNGCRDVAVLRVTSEKNALNGIKVRGARRVLVEDCLIRNNGRGLEVSGSRDCTFRGNVLFANAWRGPEGSSYYEILLDCRATEDLADPVCRDITFQKNTVVNPGGATRRLRKLVQIDTGCTKLTFRKNILYASGQPVLGFAADGPREYLFADNCLYSRGGVEVLVTGGAAGTSLANLAGKHGLKASGNVFGDPLFGDIKSGDLRLRAGSPAPGRGAALRAGCSLPGRPARAEPATH